ncbi:MAG: hypothetical protein QOJ59_4427, partial [Thermomicrobiales bacterium]|nr:hypothetical protein [Thermomicrobiales bacterium]
MTREADVFRRIGDAVEGRRGELIELIQELVR